MPPGPPSSSGPPKTNPSDRRNDDEKFKILADMEAYVSAVPELQDGAISEEAIKDIINKCARNGRTKDEVKGCVKTQIDILIKKAVDEAKKKKQGG
jgi:hypothetical protein